MAGDLRLPNLNSVIISGRLTRDVELRYTANGSPVAKLSIAFNRYYRDESGEGHEETYFIDATVWMKRAEQCAEYLHKGSPVIVEGNLRTHTYVDRNNQNRKAVEIFADRIHFLEWGNRSDNNYQGTPKANEEMPPSDVTDDDVPF